MEDTNNIENRFFVLYEDYPELEGNPSVEEVAQEAEMMLDCLLMDLERFFDKGNILVAVGSIGTWQGRCDGGKLIFGTDDLLKLFEDDNVLYEDAKGDLHLRAAHHDGTNYVDFRKLNKYGRNYYFNHGYSIDNEYYGYDRRTVCERLLKPRYSTKVHMRKELGWV